MKTHHGGCHCGRVTYEVALEIDSVIECNCSHCQIKGLLLAFAPRSQFTLKSGEDALTEYRFNTKKIRHLFCSTCGVESYGEGKDQEGNDMVSINVRALRDIDLAAVKRTPYNGKD